MRKHLLLVLFLLPLQLTCLARDYYFQAYEDHLYENPANWMPSYPGTQIQKGDRVILMDDVNFTGFDLTVNGRLEVALGTKVFSSQGNINIGKEGVIENEGELLVHTVRNYGNLFNRISAIVHINAFMAFQGAYTHNSVSASFITIQDLKNHGRFDNYGTCKAGNDFHNSHKFYQINNSNLDVSGERYLKPGSMLTRSPSQSMRETETKKVSDIKIPKEKF